MKLFLTRFDSPLGGMHLVTDEHDRVHALDFGDHRARLLRLLNEHHGRHELIDVPSASAAGSRLHRYFGGELTALDEIQTGTGGSEFQRTVWSALRAIAPGQTTTYGELARRLGYTDPRMAKEIGAAIGANPIAIVVPCHRVIGKDGDLKGYAWGLHRKKWLLEHEGATIQRETLQAHLAL